MNKRRFGCVLCVVIVVLGLVLAALDKLVGLGEWHLPAMVFVAGWCPVAALLGGFYYVLDSFLA